MFCNVLCIFFPNLAFNRLIASIPGPSVLTLYCSTCTITCSIIVIVSITQHKMRKQQISYIYTGLSFASSTKLIKS